MSELKDILDLYDRASKSPQEIALATVIKTEGPSYRSAGSRSLIIEDGTFGGGLSAGCLEGDIACRLDGNKTPFIVTYDLSEEDDIRGFPFGCGGTVEIFVEPLPNQLALNTVRWLSELQEPAVLLTVVKSDNDLIALGSRFGRSASGSNVFGEFLNELATIIDAVFKEQKSGIHMLDMKNQSVTIFADFYEPPVRITIFGDGEDAHILEVMARSVGMTATRISRNDARTAISLLEENPSLRRSHTVVMTHDLHLDTKILQQLLPAGAPYLGIMGPRSRTIKMLASVCASPEDVLNRCDIYAPVGLNMAAETPGEIALSIIAEIQTVSKRSKTGHLRDTTGAIHTRKTNNEQIVEQLIAANAVSIDA